MDYNVPFICTISSGNLPQVITTKANITRM
jgi:hypothetical protein